MSSHTSANLHGPLKAVQGLDVQIRFATEIDIPLLVGLFSLPDEGNNKGDHLEYPLSKEYYKAFEHMKHDPNNRLYVAELNGRLVGAFQLTFIQYLAFRGGRAAQIENVIVDPSVRRRGVGKIMMQWAITQARLHGCFRVQLTTNKVRKAAQRFYDRLGFVPTHEGMRLSLRDSA